MGKVSRLGTAWRRSIHVPELVVTCNQEQTNMLVKCRVRQRTIKNRANKRYELQHRDIRSDRVQVTRQNAKKNRNKLVVTL
jgi:hypothetical protein